LEELSDMIRRLLVFSTVLVALLSLISAPAFADHGVAHNGDAPATTAVPVEADTATDDEGEAAADNDETETDGGGLPGWVIPLAIAVVVVGAALASRKRK
jgi:hypothetical protein